MKTPGGGKISLIESQSKVFQYFHHFVSKIYIGHFRVFLGTLATFDLKTYAHTSSHLIESMESLLCVNRATLNSAAREKGIEKNDPINAVDGQWRVHIA